MAITTKLMGRRGPRIARTARSLPKETARLEQAQDH